MKTRLFIWTPATLRSAQNNNANPACEVATQRQVWTGTQLGCPCCRFGKWTLEQCYVEECVEAHTNVDVIVDIEQLKTMLDARIPRVLAGESVKKMIKAGLSVWPDGNPDGPQPWKVSA